MALKRLREAVKYLQCTFKLASVKYELGARLGIEKGNWVTAAAGGIFSRTGKTEK